MGVVAPIGIFFHIKVLEILTIVAPIKNPKKKLQPKVMNPIRDCPYLSKILASQL